MATDFANLLLNAIMLPILFWGLEKLFRIERRLTRIETLMNGDKGIE